MDGTISIMIISGILHQECAQNYLREMDLIVCIKPADKFLQSATLQELLVKKQETNL